MKKVFVLTGLALLLAGCGVSFKSVPLNTALPENFKKRTLYPHTDIFRFKLPELAGSVLYRHGEGGDFERGARVVKTGYTAVLEPIKEDQMQVYSSKIDRGAAVQGSYLVFAAGISDEQTADIDVRDTSLVFIKSDDFPLDQLRAEALKPNPIPNTHRYWVQGALLTAITVNNYVKISANASAVVGETFGAKGNVYNKQGATQHDYWISLELVDLDRLAIVARPVIDIQRMPTDSKNWEDFLRRVKADQVRIEKLDWR
jgi:hypothetical protein